MLDTTASRGLRRSLQEPAAVAVRDSNVVIRGCRLVPWDRPKETPYGLLAAGRVIRELIP